LGDGPCGPAQHSIWTQRLAVIYDGHISRLALRARLSGGYSRSGAARRRLLVESLAGRKAWMIRRAGVRERGACGLPVAQCGNLRIITGRGSAYPGLRANSASAGHVSWGESGIGRWHADCHVAPAHRGWGRVGSRLENDLTTSYTLIWWTRRDLPTLVRLPSGRGGIPRGESPAIQLGGRAWQCFPGSGARRRSGRRPGAGVGSRRRSSETTPDGRSCVLAKRAHKAFPADGVVMEVR
jgi:hypothetical protein